MARTSGNGEDPAASSAEEDAPDLDVFFPEEGGDGVVQVYRRTPKEDRARGAQPWTFLGSMQPEEFDLEAVRSVWGGGRYQFRFWKHPAQKKGNYLGSRNADISGAARDPGDADDGDEPDELEVRGGGVGVPELAAMLFQMQRQMKELVVSARNPAPEHETQSPATLALSIVGAVKDAVSPYQKALLDHHRVDREEEGARFDAFMKGMQFAQGLGSGENGDNGGDGYIMKLGERLLGMLADKGAAGGGAGAGGTYAAVDHSKVPPGGKPGWTRFVEPYLPQLLSWAEEGKSPELRAHLILEEIPSAYDEAITAELARPDMAAEFFNMVPDAAPHRRWFETLFQTMRESFSAPVEEGDGDGREIIGG